MELSIAIKIAAHLLIAFCEEVEGVGLSSLLNPMIAARCVVEIEMRNTSIADRVNGHTCCILGISPQLTGVIISVFTFSTQLFLGHCW